MQRIIKTALFAILLTSLVCIPSIAAPEIDFSVDSIDSALVQEQPAELSSVQITYKGDGTEASPYLISTQQEFLALDDIVQNDLSGVWFALECDIDFSGVDYVPIGFGSGSSFSGIFDGRGYALKNITCNVSSMSEQNVNAGVFASAKNASFYNLGIVNAKFDVSSPKYARFGFLCGSYTADVQGNYYIDKCYAEGVAEVFSINEEAAATPYTYAGGLLGEGYIEYGKRLEVTDCYADVDITATANSHVYAGGLFGKLQSKGKTTVLNCAAFGSVVAATDGNSYQADVGGVAGYFNQDDPAYSGWYPVSIESETDAQLMATAYVSMKNVFADVYIESYPEYSCVNNKPNGVDIGNIVGYYGEYHNFSNLYYCSDMTAVNSKELNAVEGTSVDRETLYTEDFLSGTLNFDFENTWQIVNGAPILKTNTKLIEVYEKKIAYGKTTVKAEAVNTTSATLICAKYDSYNRMTGTYIKTVTDTEKAFEFDITDAKYVKFFLLDSNLSPLGEAEVDNTEATANDDERFVKSWDPVKNADGDLYIEYTLYNPYTAKFETALGDTKDAETTPFALGDLVFIDSAGKIDESQTPIETIAATGSADEDYYWILDYDASSKLVEVAPIGDEDASFTLYVEDAVVSQIGAGQSRNGANMITYSAPKALSLSDLGSDAKALKAINNKFIKEEGADYSTVYGKYIKAFINFEWKNDDDHSEVDADTGCNGEASFFVVITNNNEDFSLCKTPAGWVAPYNI